MIIVSLVIKLGSPGPVLDRQNCIGCNGRRFQALKFRTTVHDPKHATAPWTRQTTQVGEFLRYTPTAADQCAAWRDEHHRSTRALSVLSRLAKPLMARRGSRLR